MLLHQFTVKGYKNLTQLITYGPLGRINVIHGPNNVGKSNLLQAMDLFFRILNNPVRKGDSLTLNKSYAPKTLAEWGYPVDEIFNLVKPGPLELCGEFQFTAEECTQLGLEPSQPLFPIGIRLSRRTNSVDIRKVTHLTDGTTNKVFSQILEFLMSERLLTIEKFTSRFALIGINRHLQVEDSAPSGLHVVPQQLRDGLFDAKESREIVMVNRWKLFVETMQEFKNILGPGHFDTAYDRQKNQADLVFDAGMMRVPVNLLGSGVQQIVALLGQLLLTRATFVGIEEPELNLRYTLQKQLLAAFQRITQSEYGPQQLFLTSHSPAFEAEESFFAMELKNDIPVLSQKPREMARIYTGTRDEEDQHTEAYALQPEPPSYVSSEGLVMLPEDIRQKLNIEHGGGVSFIPNKETGRFEIWTTDELDAWLTGSKKNSDDA
jgi:ABC-type branched-subunit amino acid transport system ATPase component